jgi:hypothetical protein
MWLGAHVPHVMICGLVHFLHFTCTQTSVFFSKSKGQVISHMTHHVSNHVMSHGVRGYGARSRKKANGKRERRVRSVAARKRHSTRMMLCCNQYDRSLVADLLSLADVCSNEREQEVDC